MARAILSPVRPSADGVAYSLTAPTVEGDAVLPGSALLVDNASAGPLTVTLVTPGTVDGLAVADRTVTVPAGTAMAIDVPDGSVYKQTDAPTRGYVHVDYDVVASVTRLNIAT